MAINLGSTAIAGAYVGTTAVSKIYKGSTEIWSGSTPPTPTGTQYGKIYYYSDFTNDYYIDNEDRCMMDIVNSNTFFDYFASIGVNETSGTMPYDITFDYDGATNIWTCHGSDAGGQDSTFSNDDIESTIGMMSDFFGEPVDTASFHIIIDIDVDTTSATTSYELVSSADYDLLNDKMSYALNSEYLQLPRLAIVSFELGDSVTATPNQFLCSSSNLTSVDFTYASALTSINNGFLKNCVNFNSPISMPDGVITIGHDFLYGCTSFNSTVDVNNAGSIGYNFLASCSTFDQPISYHFDPDNGYYGIDYIGNDFLSGCSAFAQSFTVPGALSSINANFMYNCNKFVGPLVCNNIVSLIASNNTLATTNRRATMYTKGVTLTGSYAQSWKAIFPDRTTSPYRKLIVGS